MGRQRGRGSRSAWAGLALIGAEGLVALTAGPSPVLVGCLLVLVPGLALAPLLPHELKAPVVRLTVVPVVGVGASSLLLVTLSELRVPLTGLSIRLLLLLTGLAGVLASTWRTGEGSRPLKTAPLAEGSALVLLGSILCLGITLQGSIVGGTPLPGEDWGHYLLYADQIRQQHSLLIDNPYWMLGGQRFAEDPGAPSLYSAYVLLTGEPTSVLLQGIWVFAALAVVSVFTFAATLWGTAAGLISAGLYAAVPMNLDMLSWYGLANIFGLVLLPIVLLALGIALRERNRGDWAMLLGLGLVALAAAHRLTFLVACLALVPCVAVLVYRRRRETVRLVLLGGAGVVLGGGVVAYLVEQGVATKGLQGYHAYLPTKVHWHLVDRDLTTLLGVLGAIALLLVLLAPGLRRDASRFVLFSLSAAILALTYAWVVHVPTSYDRPSYFLPLLLAVAVGVALGRLAPRLAVLAIAAIVLVAFQARDLAPDFRGFYGYVNRESLAVLGKTERLVEPGQPVVTDTCWAFLAPWLLQRPTLAALDPSFILPAVEVEPARLARRILYGGPAGASIARRTGIRYALVDPLCTHAGGTPVAPPDIGTPVFASTRLVVLDLRSAADRAAGATG
jgi:hypothetical protein